MKKTLTILSLIFLFYACENNTNSKQESQVNDESNVKQEANVEQAPKKENQIQDEAAEALIGTYKGKLDNKNLTLVIDKAENGKLSGYNIAGKNKRPVEGTYSVKKIEFGYMYKIILKEPGDDKWDGIFKLTYYNTNQIYDFSGTWSSYNGKLKRKVVFD